MGKKSRSRTAAKTKKAAGGGGGSKRKNHKREGAHPFGAETTRRSNDAGNVMPSIYQVYKEATLQFKEQLLSLVPANIFAKDYVQSFLDAADYVKDNGISVSDALLRNLRLAINVRKKYSRRLLDGGDAGHAYFLLVLNYCHQVLKQCRKEVPDEAGRSKNDDADDDDEMQHDQAFLNRFGALNVEGMHGEESDSDDESSNDDSSPTRPEPPSEAQYSFRDMVSFPDRAKCLFLFDAMAYNAHKFTRAIENLKETMRMEAERTFPTKRLIPEFVCIGALSKMIMTDLDRMEKELYMECPVLGESPYRILACCFLSPFINLVSQNARTHSPLAKRFTDDVSVAFFGDIIEAVFRGEPKEAEKVSERFSKKWKLPEHWASKNRWLAYMVVKMTMKNTMTPLEEQWNPSYSSSEEEKGLGEMPKWLEEEEFWGPAIGGQQSMFNTWRLLDLFGANMGHSEDNEEHPINKLMTHYMCRPKWDGEVNPARTIRGDMDPVLVITILHIIHSKWRFDGGVVPMESNMLPLVSLCRKWTMGMESKPPLAFAFGLHMMLMSMHGLQGDGDGTRLRDIAKSAYSKFMLKAEEHLKMDIPCHPEREEYLKCIIETKRLTEPSDGWDEGPTLMSLEGYDLLFWNPMSAGLLLGYTIYLSLDGGINAINTSFEATTVLHLFNALKNRGLVDEDLPILSDIDHYFDNVKCIWNGWAAKPTAGKFTYRYHLSMGSNIG